MGCEKMREKKDQNKRCWMRSTNQQQSARQRRHDIVIQSSGHLQVSGNKILIM